MTDAYATIKVLAQQQQRRDIRVVVNQVSRLGEGRAIRGQLQLVVDRFVTPALNEGHPTPVLELLGEIPLDPGVREAVQKRRGACGRGPGREDRDLRTAIREVRDALPDAARAAPAARRSRRRPAAPA